MVARRRVDDRLQCGMHRDRQHRAGLDLPDMDRAVPIDMLLAHRHHVGAPLSGVAFLTMKPSTKGVYRNAIERLCLSKDKDGNEIGGKSAATLQREHVVKLMAARAEKPESANLLRKVLRAMMVHAVETGLRADDPTRDVKAIRVKSDGFHSWTDPEIAQFEAHHAIGSRPRLALGLLLYTGQRRSDVVTMGKQHIDRNGSIHI